MDNGAKFNIPSFSGLTYINGYASVYPNGVTNAGAVHFRGLPEDIETALNSITFNTGSVSGEVINLEVYIGPNDNAQRYFSPSNGHIYEYVSGNINWSAAREASTGSTYDGVAGYLVTITSQEEQSFINARVSQKYWMGLSDEVDEGTFEWMDGPEAGTEIRISGVNVSGQYNNWASNQPDGADYVLGNFGNRQWDDDNDNSGQVNGYIVEYGASTSGITTPFSSIATSTVTFTQSQTVLGATIAAVPLQTYTGSAITPTLDITYNGTSLVKDTDYTVSFANNISLGTATATITGINAYTGTTSTTFEIVEITPPTAAEIPTGIASFSNDHCNHAVFLIRIRSYY